MTRAGPAERPWPRRSTIHELGGQSASARRARVAGSLVEAGAAVEGDDRRLPPIPASARQPGALDVEVQLGVVDRDTQMIQKMRRRTEKVRLEI